MRKIINFICRHCKFARDLRYNIGFIRANRYIPCFKNPQTFNEKINYRKNHPKNELFSVCADKIKAKEYVADKLSSDYVIENYYVGDNITTEKIKEILVEKGFTVLPYCHADPVLCQRLEAVGCAAVMPLGSPIGSNQGLASETFLSMIIEQATVPVIVDAGIGSPSDATKAMELGADGVLVNTAIATAGDPILMAKAFRLAVQSGRLAYEARLAEKSQNAQASSPLTAFLL
jgi:thiazole synthase ThiGH ThiG subunit